MSQCLSNLSISKPMSSQASFYVPNLVNSRFSHLSGSPISNRNLSKNVVKAMVGEDGNKLRSQQLKKRPAPVAPVGLWDRFPTARTVQQMMETMERIVEDPFAYSGGWPSPSPPTDTVGYSRGRTPWEIKEAESEYKMRFDMPGMTKEDVKVWVEEKMLVVKAEKVLKKKSENEEENDEEWSAKSYGRYSSRIALPDNVQFEKIKAEVKDGVLYITIPKASSDAKVFDISVE